MHRAVTLFILISAVSIIPLTSITIISRVEKHTFFSPNFAVFDTLFIVRAYIDCWEKNNPFYFFSCTSIISTFEYKCPPPGSKLVCLQTCQKQVSQYSTRTGAEVLLKISALIDIADFVNLKFLLCPLIMFSITLKWIDLFCFWKEKLIDGYRY